MRKVLLMSSSFLCIKQLKAQTIHDTVFNEVIRINAKEVTTDGPDFLVDIPLKPEKEPIIIFNNDERIPLRLFCERESFLSGQNEIILITPDWQYYEGIRAAEKREPGLLLDPLVKNKFYHIRRSRNSKDYTVDSLSRTGYNSFTINYKKVAIKENEVKFYYTHAELPEYTVTEKAELDKLNAQLEVNVYEGVYRDNTLIVKLRTDKGEVEKHPVYYTLSALPQEKKLPAIKAMERIQQSNFEHGPRIFLPYMVIKKQ